MNPTTNSKGVEVFIQTVTDKRTFEEAPKSPNIPSLDPSEAQNDDIKLRAVARKRNTFGKGLGDILLNEGQTVQSIVHDSVRQAFIENGFTVIDKNDTAKKPYLVDVQINKFWSWMNPGFWAITLSTEIETDITVLKETGPESERIYIKAADHFQAGTDGNWVEVMNSALKDYLSQLKTKFK